MRKLRASRGCLAVTLLSTLAMLLLPGAVGGAENVERTARVAVCAAETGSVEQLLALSGRVRYAVEYAALAPCSGVVAEVYVAPGQSVDAGQALFRMDGTAAEAALSRLLAEESALPEAAQALAPAAQTLLADVADSGAGLLAARAQVEALTVRAQVDGLVQQVDVTAHSGLAAGTPAMTLTGDTQQVICGAVKHDAEKLACGMRVRLLQKGAPVGTGRVKQIAPAAADLATGAVTHQVTIALDGGLDLPMGAAVEAEIVALSSGEATVIPLQALTEQGTVWWVAEGRAWETPVTVWAQDEVNACVDLPLGTEVVTQGHEGLVPGQKVREGMK